MPFVSKRQRKYMWANMPEMAKEFEKKTPKNKPLPEKSPGKRAKIGKVKKI